MLYGRHDQHFHDNRDNRIGHPPMAEEREIIAAMRSERSRQIHHPRYIEGICLFPPRYAGGHAWCPEYPTTEYRENDEAFDVLSSYCWLWMRRNGTDGERSALSKSSMRRMGIILRTKEIVAGYSFCPSYPTTEEVAFVDY